MPYIIKNGKTYTGNSVTLTQAQYDALSEAEKNNGTAYYIYDSNAVMSADDVALDNGTVEDLAGSVATIESSPATAIHAVGDFILWNGQLYSVISPIDVGQTLTVGSNITATSAGSELTSLMSGLSNKATYEIGTWYPQIYDFDTLKLTLPASQYIKIGGFYVMLLPQTTLSESVSFGTMFQIRGLPCNTVFGGQVYVSTIVGNFGEKTVQASSVGVYIRPNYTGTISSGTLLTGIFFGV